ncbi:MAG: carboxypeptidase-like regulatory domain-containing protein [Bacteroidota bacterium]
MKYGCLLIFFCTPLYMVSQSKTTKITDVADFLQTNYNVSLAYGADVEEVRSFSPRTNDLMEVVNSLRSNSEYELYIWDGDEMMIRRRSTDDDETHRLIQLSVQDVDGNPIHLAAAGIPNTTIGGYTNEDGELQLQIPPQFHNERLQVSMIGFQSQEVRVGDLPDMAHVMIKRNGLDVAEIVIEDQSSLLGSTSDFQRIRIDIENSILASSAIAGGVDLRSLQVLPGIANFDDSSSDIDPNKLD